MKVRPKKTITNKEAKESKTIKIKKILIKDKAPDDFGEEARTSALRSIFLFNLNLLIKTCHAHLIYFSSQDSEKSVTNSPNFVNSCSPI